MKTFRSPLGFWKFHSKIQWNEPFRFSLTSVRGSTLTSLVILVDWTEMSSSIPLSCILLTKTIIIRTVAWVGSVQLECAFPLGTWNFQNFTLEFLLNLW